VVMKEQSYTSTPPMGCTTGTEPQCLYKGAFYSQVLAMVVLRCLAEIIASSGRIDYLRPRKDNTEPHPIRRTSLAKKYCMWYNCIRINFDVSRSLYEVCRMSACFIPQTT